MVRRYFFTAVTLLFITFISGGCSKTARCSRHIARGDREVRAERYDRAEIEYQTARKSVPMDPTAIAKLGVLYFTEGRMPLAYDYLKKAVEFHPDDTELRSKFAQTCFDVSDFTNAWNQALNVLAKQPDNPEAIVLLGEAAFRTNQIKASWQKLDALPSAVKNQAAYHIARGTLWLRQGNLTNSIPELKQAIALDSKSMQAQLALGLVCARLGQTNEAQACLKSAADLAPLRSKARMAYAEFRFNTGARDEAKKLVTEITQKAPDYVPAWMFLVKAALAERRLEDCSALIQKVLERDPYNLEALLTRADLLLAKRDGTNALVMLERAGAMYKQRPEILYRLAQANLLNNDVAKATANLSQAITVQTNVPYTEAILLLALLNVNRGEASQAVPSLKELVRQQPGLFPAYQLLAAAYQRQQDMDSAVAVYKSMQRRFPKDWQTPYLLGKALLQQAKAPEAREAFEKALELSPQNPIVIEDLVNMDLQAKDYSAALDRVEKFAAKDSRAPQPALLAAKIHIEKAKNIFNDVNATPGSARGPKASLAETPAAVTELNQAETNILRAIELQPDLPGPYVMLSEVYESLGKKQQALAELNNILAKTNNPTALLKLGMIQQASTNYPAARDAYEKAISLDPNFALGNLALNNLAYIYSEPLPDLPKARRLAEQARQVRPRDPATADTLGWILYKQSEHAHALSLIEEAAAALPDSAEVQYHLGMAYYAMAEEGPARTALDHAARSKENFPGKPEATNYLAILSINPGNADAAAKKRLEEHLKQKADDAIALSRLAAIEERDGEWDKALDAYERALKSNPQNARIMLKVAQIYASPHFHDPQKAFDLAKKAHNAAPDDASISALLGRLAFETGDYNWAASLLEDSARKLPKDAQVSYDLAWAFYSLGRVPEAEAAMQTAAGTPFSQSEDAKRFLKMVDAAKGPAVTPTAAAEAGTILKADPNNVPALMVSALDQESHGNYQQAGACYDKMLARFPLFAPATRNLAILCFDRLGDDKKAYELATKARQTYRGDAAIARILGLLAYRKQDYGQAVQFLKEAQLRQADDAEVLCYLGLAQYQLKARAESKATLQKALASKTIQPKMAEEARRVLAELK